MNTIFRSLSPSPFIRSLIFTALTALVPLGSAAAVETPADQPVEPRISGPHEHGQLRIYLLHSPDRLSTSAILTLDEAIEAKQIRVHETSNVNSLSVENLSKDKSIFIQAGDIVKGGKQDRVLSSDLILQPKSGKVPLEAFCVEHGRWSPRGDERADRFSSSKHRINSKELKIAAFAEKRQDKVWEEVEKVQDSLARSVRKSVKNEASPSSLQLSLEDGEVRNRVDAYRKAFEKLVPESPDAVGYVAVIGGTINSAEQYGSHELFVRLWPKLLDATASEAVSTEASAQVSTEPAPVIDAAAVRAFFATARKGTLKPETAGGNRGRKGASSRVRSGAATVSLETTLDGQVLHSNSFTR